MTAKNDDKPDFRVGRAYRVTRSWEISRLFAEGSRASDGVLTLFARPNATDPPRARAAYGVGRKHGTAVRRNRVRRLCREAFRSVRGELPSGWDYMLVPRAGVDLTVEKLARSVVKLAGRATRRRSDGES